MVRNIIILSIISLLISCSGINKKEFASVDELLKDAKTQVDYVTAEELNAALTSGDVYYLIDCREPEEFNIACIPQAMNIPRGTLEGSVSEKAPKHRNTVYLYCDNGDRSTLAALVLPQLKYACVKVLEGGFEAWKAKYPEKIELQPVRGGGDTKAAPKPSGGCGG